MNTIKKLTAEEIRQIEGGGIIPEKSGKQPLPGPINGDWLPTFTGEVSGKGNLPGPWKNKHQR